MGKIKKILENELLGGTQNTDVYPITSTQAVYNENNEKLSDILVEHIKRIQGTSKDSDAAKDPFKFLGNFIRVTGGEFLNALNAMHGTDADVYDGYWRALIGASPVEIYNFAIYYKDDHWIQVLKSPYRWGDGDFDITNDTRYRTIYRIHENGVWGEWKDTEEELKKSISDETTRAKDAEQKLKDEIDNHLSKNVAWNSSSNLNDFTTAGVYNIQGERTMSSEYDNLPIDNRGSGHTISARLEVLDSSIDRTTNSDDKCITQKLTLSNRVGGDGNVYIRTGRGKSYDSITWEKWGTLQTNINVGRVGSLDEFVDNGIYSGVWTDGSSFAQTFVMVVINDYAVAGGNKTIVQYKYAYDTLKGNGEPTYNTRSLFGGVWSDWEDVHDDDLNVLKSELLNAIKEETLRAKNEEFRIDYKSEDIIESIGARIISKKHIIHREVGKSYTKLVYIGNLPAQQYKSRFFLYDLINDDVTINLCNKNGDVVINLGTIISDTADIEATFNIENNFDAWLSVNLPISQKDYSVDLYCTLIPKNTILDIINDEITRAKNAESVNSIAIGEEEFRAIKAEKTLQKNIDKTNNIVGIEEKGWLTTEIGAVMKDGSTYSTNNSAYTNAFEGGDIAVTNEGYYIYDVRKVSADGVAEMVAVNSKRLRTEKGYTYQLNISKDNNSTFSKDELEGIVGLYNYDSSEIEKNKTDIQYLFEEAVKFDSFEVEELGDGIGINYDTIDGNSGSSIEIPFATEENGGFMSAEDKKALDDVPKNIAKEKTAIVNGDTIAGLAREVYSRTGKVDTATFLKRTTAGGTTISDGVASIKEIGGNIVKNIVSMSSVVSWNSSNADFSSELINTVIRKKEGKIGMYMNNIPFIQGHKYYLNFVLRTDVEGEIIYFISNYNKRIVSNGNWSTFSFTHTIRSDYDTGKYVIVGTEDNNINRIYLSNIFFIDLTEMFGAGKEPTKEECDRLFGNMDALPQGLTISQPKGLKSVGYNQWNPVNVLRNKSIVENSIEDDVENSHIAVVECLPCKIGEGENNGYVVGYGEGEQWDEDGIEVYFSPLNPMDYIDQDVDLYMHKLEQDATYGTYVPQCKGYLLVVTPTTDKLCVNFHWSGDRSRLDYEEYTESNVALPEIPQMSEWGLAGIQSSGTLVADTIDLDRMVYTKRIGAVDLGSFGWGKNENFEIPRFASIKLLNNCVGGRVKNYACAKYPCMTDDGPVTVHILINDSRVIIWDNINTVEELKQNLQGVMLYYELAEPEEYPIVAKTAPNYIGSDYGVEEFTGSKVPLNANILFYMRSLVGETRNFLDRLYDNTDKTDAKEVADYITNGIEGNKELATNAPNLALRALFIAAGAEYNDTGADITKTALWGETVTHKAGHYYLNGLGDITEEQMIKIYNMGKYWKSEDAQGFGCESARTNLPPKQSILYYYKTFNLTQSFNNTDIEVVNFIDSSVLGTTKEEIKVSNLNFFTQSAKKLKRVIGTLNVSGVSVNNFRVNGTGLEFIYIKNLKVSMLFNNSQSLKKESVLYMIVNASPTSAITITLHPDAYARLNPDLEDNADIKSALEAQPLITLASA